MLLTDPRTDSRFEVALHQLSDLERDTLGHYPGGASAELAQELRGAIMVFENVLSELWHLGLRLRIVPTDTRITDLPECFDMKNSWKAKNGKNWYDEHAAGVYRPDDKLVIVKEEYLCIDGPTNQKYWVIIHEFAHAIWDLLLTDGERAYITHLFEEERRLHPNSKENRLQDEWEFFADGFLYFVTPNREGLILEATGYWCQGPRDVDLGEGKGVVHASKDDLKVLNIKLYAFTERKFRKIIDPELVMARPLCNGEEEERFETWDDTGIYGPIIHIGTVDFSDDDVAFIE